MSMSVGGGQSGPKADINMTPMIDVLLVLIIIFMVITPLTPKGLEALVPQPAPPNQKTDADQRTVVISVAKDKSLMINQEATDEAKLGPRLEEIFKTRAERVVFVIGDPDLEFQGVAKVIDVAKGVGIDKVGLMTPEMEEGR
jgi:biopolymer transport protein TolR